MKNRFLPFGLISAFLGFFLVYMSAGSMAGQPGTPDLKKHNGSRMDIIRGNQHTGTVDPLDVLKGRLQAADMNTKSTSGPMNLDWINMGPNNYSGAVWSVIFDNSDPTQSTLIAGAAGGGLWKSINLGLTWFQMPSQDNVVPRVSSLVQTSSGTVYAGTGVTQCKVVDVAGTGIYRSDNGGVFTVIPSTQNNPDFAAVAKLVIDPKSGRIFAATFGGLYYSDNGNDWVKAKSGYTMDVCVGSDGTVITATGDSAYIAPEGNLNGWVTLTTGLNNALPKIGIGWMVFAIAPSDPSVMYASFAKTDGNLLNLYCSIDKGATWSVIFPNNPSFEPFRTKGCYSNTLAVFPSDPNRLLLGGINMWYGERIQSAGFFNWEMVSIGAYSPWFPNSAPEYQHSFIFRPNNPNQVAMATDGGVCIATIYPNGFAFKTINKEMTTGQFNSVAFSAQKSYVMGGGENIGVLGMGYFYPLFTNSANDGYPVWMPEGLLTGGNGGTCVWSNIDSRISVFTKYQLTPTAFAATPSTRRRDFTDLTYVNDFMNGIHPVDSSYIPMRLWESFNFTQTRDSVKVYARINTIPADTTLMVESANNRFPFPYVTKAPLVKGDSLTIADPIANRFFYFGRSDETGRGIYMTKDMLKFNRDPRYFLVFKDTKLTDPITTMTISADLNTLWAGTQLGRLIRVSGLINAYDSATANVTSSQCVLTDSVFSFPGVTGRYVTSISINPSNSSQVLVTLGQYGNTTYIYHSQDGNAPRPTFSPKQSNLPQVPVYSGIIEMHNSSSAFVGTELGVFSTTNLNSDNPTWGADMQNIGDVAITEIGQQVINDYHILNKGVIYIATYGRGLWMDTTYSIPVGIEPVQGKPAQHGTLNLSPNPVTDDLNITYASEMSGNLTAVVYDLTGRTVLSRNFGTQPKGTFIGRINLSNLPKGTYLVKLGNGYGKIVKM